MESSDVRFGHVTRARRLLAMLEPLVDLLRTGDAREAMRDLFELTARSAVVRQNDALAHAIRAVEEGCARNIAVVIRPAVEELVTISYLMTIPRADASEFISTKMAMDIGDALDAQNRLFVNPLDAAFGIPPVRPADRAAAQARMVTLATRHGWPIRARSTNAISYGPTMSWMAREVGRGDLYEYLYGAASRLVHFSPTELLRRCWFNGENRLSIGGDELERWWASFAVGWGSVLLAETVAVALELLGALDIEHPPPEGLGDLVTACKANIPPLVTLGELNLDLPQQRSSGS
jgi:Family of unknown function (DUF5677)